ALAADPRALDSAIYGSGPYTLVSAAHGGDVVFQRRDEWKWGPQGTTAKNLPARVVIRFVDNDTTRANLLLTGGVDVGTIAGADVDRLVASKQLDVQTARGYMAQTIL